MNLFVDTSVWSLALRRDSAPDVPEVQRLRDALAGGEPVHTMGIVLQELLQGYRAPKAAELIVKRFAEIAMITPTRGDYIRAAELHNTCRAHGVQAGTIDALLSRICIRHDLVMLSTDRDFGHIANWTPLKLWRGSSRGLLA